MPQQNKQPKPYTDRERAIARAAFANLIMALAYNDMGPQNAMSYLVTSGRSATKDCHSAMCGFETIFDNCLSDAVEHVNDGTPLGAATLLDHVNIDEDYMRDWPKGQQLMQRFWRKFKTPVPEITGDLSELLLGPMTSEIREAVRAAERHVPYTTEELLHGRKPVR